MLGEGGSWGPTAEPPTFPFPEVGSHNAPEIRMIQGFSRWQQQAFASGKQAAVEWQGLGSSVGRGRWWKRGKGPCQVDILWEEGRAADGAFRQLLLERWDGAVGKSSPFFTALVKPLSASDPACREPPSC